MSNNSNTEFPEDIPGANQAGKPPQMDVAQIAIDSANVGIWLINSATQEFLPSNRTKELFGFGVDEEMSVGVAMKQVLEKYRQNTIKAIENAFQVQSGYTADIDHLIPAECDH